MSSSRLRVRIQPCQCKVRQEEIVSAAIFIPDSVTVVNGSEPWHNKEDLSAIASS